MTEKRRADLRKCMICLYPIVILGSLSLLVKGHPLAGVVSFPGGKLFSFVSLAH